MSEKKQKTSISLLTQKEAKVIDEELFSLLNFSVDQLMELAGLSVACAVEKYYDKSSYPRVLVICGPGNNGGDGLVSARHLSQFGYDVTLYYPKQTSHPLYLRLIGQCSQMEIKISDKLSDSLQKEFDVIVDAIFGYSFTGDIRSPFDSIIAKLCEVQKTIPIVSVDIPSGWNVENGPSSSPYLESDMLVSLTAPKQCAVYFSGRFHVLGGRFVPPYTFKKYNLNLPPYKGSSQFVELPLDKPLSPMLNKLDTVNNNKDHQNSQNTTNKDSKEKSTGKL